MCQWTIRLKKPPSAIRYRIAGTGNFYGTSSKPVRISVWQMSCITRGSTLFVRSTSEVCTYYFRCTSFLWCLTTSLDDNGVTGPDWGHSELVFKWFHIRTFQQPPSLWMLPHFTLLICVFAFYLFFDQILCSKSFSV